MKKPKTIKHLEIEGVKVTVIKGDCVIYKIPRTFSGEKITEWKRLNKTQVDEFIKSVDPVLIHKAGYKKKKKVKPAKKKLSDYQGSTGISRKLQI